MGMTMKKIRVIDVLPTVFGIVTIVGTTATMRHIGNPGLGLLTALGGAAACLTTGLISVLSSRVKHTFSSIHIFNLLLAIAAAGFLVVVIRGFYSPIPPTE
jgi:hypothetical protein